MFTQDAKKLLSIMAKLEHTMVILGKEAQDLSNIHEKYMENDLEVSWNERGMLGHLNSWCVDAERPLLQHERLKVFGKTKTMVESNNVMLNKGLAYFMPYESFTYLELLIAIAMRYIP